MAGNIFGRHLTAMTFGESHGEAMGAVIDGCPAGLSFDQRLLLYNLARRRPGQSQITSARKEEDIPEILSGIYEGQTLGTPIAVIVRNRNQRPSDYNNRPMRVGHADDLWINKFGLSDPRGGGRASGRETLARVIVGSVAQMLLRELAPETRVVGYTKSIGSVKLEKPPGVLNTEVIERFGTRIPDESANAEAEKLLRQAKENGESFGGIASLQIQNPPPHLGSPVFQKLKSRLAEALFSVGAVCDVQLGESWDSSQVAGQEFHGQSKSVYGGIRGGISTGEDIYLEAKFKPTSSTGEVSKQGRHDPCIVPRAVPVLESMLWWVLADELLARRLERL